MLKLERHSEGERTTVRLIGRVRSEHLGEITDHMGSCSLSVILDLEEVTVVDVEVVRFLGSCEKEGTELLHCPPYIRERVSWKQRLPAKRIVNQGGNMAVNVAADQRRRRRSDPRYHDSGMSQYS